MTVTADRDTLLWTNRDVVGQTAGWTPLSSMVPQLLAYDDVGLFDKTDPPVFVRRQGSAPLGGVGRNDVEARWLARGTQTTTKRFNGFRAYMEDDAGISRLAITGCADNGAGLVRVTAAGHGYQAGENVAVWGVVGTTEANNVWTITVVDANTFDLVGSAFANAYVSGGTVTNAPMMYGAFVTVLPKTTRGGISGAGANGDDVNCFVGFNGGSAKGTDAFYLGHNSAFATSEFVTGFTWAANLDYGLRFTGKIAASGAGIDFSAATVDATSPVLKMAAAQAVKWDSLALSGNGAALFLDQADGVAISFRSTVYRNTQNVFATLAGRNANGTLANPTASVLGDILARFGGMGYGTSIGTASRAHMEVVAEETWSGTAQGARLQFSTTTPGGTTLVERLRITGSGLLQVWDGGTIAPIANVTGLKIGSASTDKLGFFGAAPVIQPSSTGTSTGFTAGGGTTATSLSTYTGNVGSIAYTVGDVVAHLKHLGLIAS